MFKKFIPLYLIVSIYSLFVMKSMTVPYSSPLFVIEYAPYLAASAFFVFGYWLIFLRATTPLNLQDSKTASFGLFWILFGYCALSLLVTGVNTSNFNFQQLLVFVGVGVAVGINEEFIFRVAGYRNFLAQGASQKKAIFISAILFSSFHLLNLGAGVGIEILFQLLNTFVMGCLLAYLYYLTRSVWYPVIIHGMWDFSLFSSNMFGTQTSKLAIALAGAVLCFSTFIWFLFQLKKLNAPIETQPLS